MKEKKSYNVCRLATHDSFPQGNMDTADTLEIATECKVTEAFYLFSGRPNIRTVIVHGHTYTRQEILTMPINDWLGRVQEPVRSVMAGFETIAPADVQDLEIPTPANEPGILEQVYRGPIRTWINPFLTEENVRDVMVEIPTTEHLNATYGTWQLAQDVGIADTYHLADGN
jgi:hypothetical protein